MEPSARKRRRLRLVLAAILRERGSMPRPQTVRLQETPGRVAPGADVIDVDYKEVGRKKRGVLRKLWMALVAVVGAALIGFLIPPAWVLIETIASYFAPAP